LKQPEVWSQIARSLIGTGRRPHFAPEEEILAVLRERVDRYVAEHGANCCAVILGATPELADMALTAGCRVVRIDCNPAMFEAAAGRQAVQDRSRETVLIGDWLDMHAIGDNGADLVLGDSSLNNVPHADMGRLLAELARITCAGGMIALRQIVLPDAPVAAYEFAAAVAAYRKGKITETEFHRMLRFYSFTADAYDPVDHLLDAQRVFAEVRRGHEAQLLSDGEFDFLMSRYSEVRHTVYRYTEQRRLLATLGALETASPAIESSARFLFQVFAIHIGGKSPGMSSARPHEA
jgi:ubiquinone/menaquinone biosynthesis C-methylase UbiE